jgi:hypothetical protein
VVSLSARPKPLHFISVEHIKGLEYGNSPYSKDNLKEGIHNTVFSVSPPILEHTMHSVFVRCDAYL